MKHSTGRSREVARILRVIYGDQREICHSEIAALSRYAADPHPDDTMVLNMFDLEAIVRAVLIDGMELPEAGREASAGRYATDIQARAYAVAMIHQAGRALVWNAQAYRPQRSSAARLAAMYQASQTALRAKIAFPANGNAAIKVKGGGMGVGAG